MSFLTDTWDRLSTHGEVGEGYVRLRLAEVGECAAYAARRVADGLEALVIRNGESLGKIHERMDDLITAVGDRSVEVEGRLATVEVKVEANRAFTKRVGAAITAVLTAAGLGFMGLR